MSRSCPKKEGGRQRPDRQRSDQGRARQRPTSARITEVNSGDDTSAKESDDELEIKSQATLVSQAAKSSTSKARSIYTQLQKLPEETKEEILERMLGITDEKGF